MLQKIRGFLFTNSSTRQIVAKNTFWLFSGEIITRLLKFLPIFYAARILGTEGWGVFSYILGTASLFLMLSDFGLNNLVTREIAGESKQKLQYLATAFFIRVALIVIAVALMFFIFPYISRMHDARHILLVIAITIALDSLRDFYIAVHRAMERMEKEATIKIVVGILTTIFGVSALMLMPSIENLAYAYLAGSSIGLIITIFSLRNYVLYTFEYFSKNLVGVILRTAWPLFIFGIIGAVMTYTDIVMLGWWKSPGDIGLYTAAQRLIQFLLVIPGLMALTTLPLFSRLVVENTGKLKIALEKTVSLALAFGLPIVSGGIILARDIITLVFGEQYASSTIVFQIFLGMLVIMFPTAIIGNYTLVYNAQKKFIRTTIIGAFINIILNILLIPKFGIYGAAFATMFSSSLLGILIWLKMKKISYFAILPHIKKIIMATMIMTLTTFSLKYFGVNLFLNIGISVATFAYALYLLQEPLLQEAKKIMQSDI